MPDADIGFPRPTSDERELLLQWLGFLRGAVLRKVEDLSDGPARWSPDGALLSLLGIINHLSHVEWRWIDGGMLGQKTSRSEQEFSPPAGVTVAGAVAAYRWRAAATDHTVRTLPALDRPCLMEEGADLRWVLLHLINETARHAGHADATRQLLDGVAGE